MPHLQLDNVTRSFPTAGRVLGPLSLRVEPRERVSLVGPSGCGKSTLLRIVAGLDTAETGTVTISASGEGHGPDKRDMGFVFQDAALMPWASVFENVWLPLRLRGMSRKRAMNLVSEALRNVGLDAWADARPDQLSGGMRMRASIARSLIEHPSLLLMDEPFAALDELTRFDLNETLSDLVESQGMTLIFVTHSVLEAAFLSSRVVILSPGPGQIVTEISLGFPFPRPPQLRSDTEFLSKCAEISKALRLAATGKLESA